MFAFICLYVRMFKNRIWCYLKENITKMLSRVERNQQKNYFICTLHCCARSMVPLSLPLRERAGHPSFTVKIDPYTSVRQNRKLDIWVLCVVCLFLFKVFYKILSENLHFIMKNHHVLSF